MSLETIHNIDRGIYRLLHAPKDIPGGTPVSNFDGPIGEADPEFYIFFKIYLEGFPILYPLCDRWWKGCVAAAESPDRTREEALSIAYEARAAGPASAPEFVWFIRRFWLDCDALNKKLPLEKRVAPEVVLLKWLIDTGEQDYLQLITCMPYWPIGLNAQGDWN